MTKITLWNIIKHPGFRADLQGADLQGADLQRADLRGANLRGADLQRADLQRADLRGAYLQRADLRGADLQRADLQGADLQRADLRGADLHGADLQRADLREADLRGAKIGAHTITSWLTSIIRYDGYQFIAFRTESGEVIRAGCRTFTIAEYRVHISAEYPYTGKAAATERILAVIEAELAA